MYHIGLMSSYTEDIGPSPNYERYSNMLDPTLGEYLIASVILVALLIVYNKE